MANLILRCDKPTNSLYELADILNNAMSQDANVVEKDYNKMDSVEVALIVFEKYFFRNNSYTTLTVQLTQFNRFQTTKLVTSSGGQGVNNVTLGAHKNILNQATSILEKYNFI